jgi:hypothetical protein
MHIVADDYRKLQNEDPATATEKLLDEYGDAAFLATVGKTQGGPPTTEAVSALGRRHPELADKYPDVWGFFTDPNSPYDPSESTRQVRAGQRQTVTPREALDMANQRLGQSIYNQYKDHGRAEPDDRATHVAAGRPGAVEAKVPRLRRHPRRAGRHGTHDRPSHPGRVGPGPVEDGRRAGLGPCI